MDIIVSTYTFTKATKIVDLSSISGFNIARLKAIFNAKTGHLIYRMGSDPVANNPLGYVSAPNGVVTLKFDTNIAAMDNTDPLTIIYDAQNDGIGVLTAIPNGSTVGVPIQAIIPANAKAVRFYFNSGEGISFAIASSQPGSAPTSFAISQATTGPNWDEPLPAGMNVYITSRTGAPLFRII